MTPEQLSPNGRLSSSANWRPLNVILLTVAAGVDPEGLGGFEIVTLTWPRCSPHPRPLAALALHNIVAFLEQALPFTVFACLFFLYVRPFFIGHRVPQSMR
jgi:hypothetical protein